ncbi:DUF932 domain-containing protein [Flagellimonas flava]|uniref:DUF932 domain-containing protein n=1 Tax=Flagellimonas flava TaxID=570519 RepID=UPI003D65BE52
MYLEKLIKDEIYTKTEVRNLAGLTGMPTRRGLERVITSNGKIVNVVSNSYGHLPNQIFFKKAEEMMQNSGLNFELQTINRDDRAFVMEFIISDKSQFTVKHKDDIILPMLRFKNSYDGSERTSGHFGFYRMVCSNGLHVAKANIHFSIRHTKNNTHLVMPRLNSLFNRFMNNEFYSIVEKFLKMQSVELLDTKKFVQEVLERTKLFKYGCSDKNMNPSKKAREVLKILDNEALAMGTNPNLWLGYNAFNAVLHRNMKKSFSQQEKLDKVLFDEILEMA